MLPPRGILEAPGHVGAAPLRGAGSSGIKVTYGQTMRVVELVVHLSQILVEVIGGGNIALPSCVASAERNVGQGNVGVDDLHRHRIQTVGADHVRDAVADESCVSGGGGGGGGGERGRAGGVPGGGELGAPRRWVALLALVPLEHRTKKTCVAVLR